MGLHMRIELVEFLHAGFARNSRLDGRTEFLEVHAYPVEVDAASAVGTFNSSQCFTWVPSFGML